MSKFTHTTEINIEPFTKEQVDTLFKKTFSFQQSNFSVFMDGRDLSRKSDTLNKVSWSGRYIWGHQSEWDWILIERSTNSLIGEIFYLEGIQSPLLRFRYELRNQQSVQTIVEEINKMIGVVKDSPDTGKNETIKAIKTSFKSGDQIPTIEELLDYPDLADSARMKEYYQDYTFVTAKSIIAAIPKAHSTYEKEGGRWGPGFFRNICSIHPTTVGRYMKALRAIGITHVRIESKIVPIP